MRPYLPTIHIVLINHLGCDPSRSSEVKSKGGFGLIRGGFLLIPIVSMGLSATVCPQFTYDLGRDPSRSSEVKSKGGI